MAAGDDKSQSLLDRAKFSLYRMQDFDVSKLPRREILGEALCFDNAVKPAKKLVDFYKKLSLSALDDFSNTYLQQVLNSAKSDFGIFTNILNFNAGNQTSQERDALVQKLEDRYVEVFDVLHPLISYSMHRAADFEGLEARARATMQEIEDKAGDLLKQLHETQFIANQTVEDIRKIAAEQGVTQQAIYFKEEAEKHSAQANRWLNWTLISGAAVLLYTLTIFVMSFYAFPKVADKYQAFQFATSKVIVFFVLSFALYFTVKNYYSHKHNSILNQHREKALLTYKAIVDAAKGSANTDEAIAQKRRGFSC